MKRFGFIPVFLHFREVRCVVKCMRYIPVLEDEKRKELSDKDDQNYNAGSLLPCTEIGGCN